MGLNVRLQRFSRLLTVGLLGGLALLMGHSAGGVAPSGDPVASAPSMAEAWSLAQAAQVQSEHHQMAEALGNFQRAYDLSGDPTLLLEVGRLEHDVGNSARAAHAFELFLERGADRMNEQRRLFATRRLRDIAADTARLRLQTNVQGAAVELEAQHGVATSEGFVVSVLLDAGERKLNLSKPGYETRSLTLVLEPGEMRALRVDLDKAVGGRRSEAVPDKPRLAVADVAPGVTAL